MKNNYCVIMAGGIGSRFWPMSRTNYPKQFLDILGTGESLLQQTYNRFRKICPAENIYIVTHDSYKELVLKQLPKLKENQVLLEPARKNTAPCVAYASFKIHELNNEANIIVAPSDHLITKEDTFVKAIKTCLRKAKSEDCLVTLGIKPSRPDTGYGYIQFKESEVDERDKRIKKVKTFTEKPDLEMAKFFLQSGDFLWNSGIFIWSSQSILNAFEKYLPELDSLFRDGKDKLNTSSEEEFIRSIYSVCKNISIDYGIMEKAPNVYVRSSIIGWSDLGTWGSLYDHIPKDKSKNALIGNNIMTYNTSGCIVNVPDEKLVVIDGLEGFIVVESDNILMICKKDDEQQIKQIVNDVKIEKGDKFV